MAKRKRARARKKKHNPTKKRAHAKRTKSAAAAPTRRRRKRANPKRTHARRRVRRATRANPRRRTHAKRSHGRRRRAVANPSRRRRRHHFSKRAHRRNPAIPVWALAALSAALGLVSYAVANDGSFAITQRLDPTLETLQRNRYIVSGVLTAAGLAVAAFLSPVLGAGVAAGGLASLCGTQLSLAIGKLIDKKNPDGSLQTAQRAAVTSGRAIKGLGAVYDPGGQQQHLAGVFGPSGVQQFGMGAVFSGGGQTFGDLGDEGQGGGSYFAG
jgi:hypothetical protein